MGSQIGCEYVLGGHPIAFLLRNVEQSRAGVSSAFALAIGVGIVREEVAADAIRKIVSIDTVDAVDAKDEALDAVRLHRDRGLAEELARHRDQTHEHPPNR